MHGMDVDHRADIYSLGVMLYEMLCREVPRGIFDPPSARVPGVNSRVDQVVAKAMQQQPERRYQSTTEMKADVAAASTRLPRGLRPTGIAAPSAQRGRLRRPLLIGVAVVIGAVAIAGMLWPKRNGPPASRTEAKNSEGAAAGMPTAAKTASTVNTATKDAPFENGLGMKFVPVPILGGPTGGQRVLFSVWDTRVQDYEVFVNETKHEWPKPGFPPTHPAVNVSWDDAQLFCQWLTARDQADGRLPVEWRYRLPSDHEWSCAVGIGVREDAAKLPAEKCWKIKDAFPWGAQWPPPAGAGNYAGEELSPALAAGKYPYIKGVIAGYNDGFANTSPVGSFKGNRFGLFDLGGNVGQWCEDWFDKDQKERVMRGASWDNSDPVRLLSSNRYHYAPESRINYGFRCVVSVSAPVAPKSPPPAVALPSTPVTATKEAPFVNSLNMKFVPVPILGGPTGGQRVLFSIWDTRVQDYQAFVQETKREWPKADFPQEPTHPAVNVSWEDAQLFCQWLTARDQVDGRLPLDCWEDAQLFCQWLTARDRADGRLPADWRYRLPSDYEWSCAVELGGKEDAAILPAEKNKKINGAFPWGTQWPPPVGAGNYAGQELSEVVAAGKYSYVKGVIVEYNDGFVNTSPVGTFKANGFGLYDMGGNVWQWCEDWIDQERKDRVVRGASWSDDVRGALLSSNRYHGEPGARRAILGFRCVVGVSTR
jgi:formylglycine-generating enzyme required for sulfatase activity